MKSKKADYSMTFYYIDTESREIERRFFLQYVPDTAKAVEWVHEKIVRGKDRSISHFCVWERKTRKLIGLYLFSDKHALNALESLQRKIFPNS